MSPDEVRACYRLYAVCRRNDPGMPILLKAGLVVALIANAAWIVLVGFALFRVVELVF
jgi:hypothetical protein